LGNMGNQPQLSPEELALIQARRQQGSCACSNRRGGILRNAGGILTLPGQTRRPNPMPAVVPPRISGAAIIRELKSMPEAAKARYNLAAKISQLERLNNHQMTRFEQEVMDRTSNLIPQIPYRKQSGGFLQFLLPALAPLVGDLISKVIG